MTLKQLLTTNLENTKVGKIVFIALTLIAVTLVVLDQFSIENKCRREVDSLVKQLPVSIPVNKYTLESAKKTQIEECIRSAKQH